MPVREQDLAEMLGESLRVLRVPTRRAEWNAEKIQTETQEERAAIEKERQGIDRMLDVMSMRTGSLVASQRISGSGNSTSSRHAKP